MVLPLKRPPSHAPTESTGVLDDGYEDAAGVIHIHTIYSDGAGTFEEIARVANQQRLDYLIVTDHNTLAPLRDGKQGWYGMTLVLVGEEISAPGGHYLALNVREDISRHQPTQAIIDEVNRQGGLGFIAHPYFKKRRWTDWTVRGFTGIEVYNLLHDAFDENRLRLAMWGLGATPSHLYLSLVDRPYDPLATWDALLARHGRVVGIGASDAHEVRLLGLKFAPYDILFQLVRTHLLVRQRPLTEAAVYEALRDGHAYVAIDLVADASGFAFMAHTKTTVLGVMGDEVPLVAELTLTTRLPAPASLTLFRDGRPIATANAQRWEVPIAAPGIYRVEAVRNGKPWIFSNPIYVRMPPTPEGPAH